MWCNLLKPRVEEMNKNSDTLSEISESGTTTSGWTSNWDAREELKDFISKIGLKDATDLYQERFRVDRKKLEQMLTGDNDALIPADVFFAKIMEDTDTYITWPNKLKLGAKSKKDPHVRIAGRPKDVQIAKERILTILGTRSDRVTMKMDVSYTDHSHIIGKGGRSIKRVMEETQCHVHFPDSNRSNPTEKSNQVSISGDIEGVECARSRVRGLIPLIFGFELPIMKTYIDVNSPQILQIQDKYKVQVIYKTRPKLHASLVLVKGVEWEVDQVKRATLLLMECMCESLANQIPVQMSMEISPHHHQTVLGRNHFNLKSIMQYTNCQIMIPDAQDPNIPGLKKNNVTITGNIHNVYNARQLLMGSLPLVIIFDLPEDAENLRIKPEQVSEIQFMCDLTINFRQKIKQNTKTCVIKGIEREASNIYKARNIILGIDEPPISADIPPTYHMPSASPNPSFAVSELPTPTNVQQNPMSPLSPMLWQSSNGNSEASGAAQKQFTGMVQNQQQHFLQPPPQNTHNSINPYSSMQQSTGSSGFHSMSHFSVNSLEQSRESNTCSTISSNSSTSSPISSPRNTNINSTSPGCYRNFSDSPLELSSVISELHLSGEQRSPNFSLTPNDYDNKRLAGLRAMKSRPTPGAYRVPTNSWSGYGISHTSPAGMLNNKPDTVLKQEYDMWNPNSKPTTTASTSNDLFNFPTSSGASNFNNSNILDHTPVHILTRVTSSNWSDLPSLLTSLGLERYINLFNNQEIDLTTFSTFTDQDFIQIGINTFGARRKLVLAVQELNKRFRPFLMAPGAERKSSPTSNSTLSYNSPKDI